MDPYTKISSLPVNSQGERTILTEHLDQSHSTITAALRLAFQTVLAQGGIITPGTVTATGAVVRAQGWTGVITDASMGVICQDQTVDLAALPAGRRALIVIDCNAGELVSFQFTDATTAESITHQLMAYPGRLRIIEGTNTEYPLPGLDSLAIAQVTRTSGGVAVDQLLTAPPVPASWVRARAVATGNRPVAPSVGEPVFDTTLGRPIWWSGSAWVDATGTAV